MSQKKRVEGLDIEQDLEFQKKEWAFERAGWVVSLLILLAALAGLFGAGPASSAAAEDETLQVQYQRITRNLKPMDLIVQAGTEQSGDGTLVLQVSRSYLEAVQIESISPEPDTTRLSPEWITYEFQTDEAGQPLEVIFNLQSQKMGSVQGTVASQDRSVRFSHFIFP